ncbi:MAG TPA: helix-turn-helix domain-containing protein, partial [Chloroflexota bacterium]|nr:helix-turn-helix domain-containing protein [Chloroflexota bacterium]
MASSSEEFSRLLLQFRVAAGLTQRQLAARAGLSARGISNLERGVRRYPYPYTVQALAGALALSPEDRTRLLAAAHPEHRLGRHPRAARPPVPPLIDREDEVEAIERHLRGSGPPLLLLSGQPGIGKTRLLREAAALANR